MKNKRHILAAIGTLAMIWSVAARADYTLAISIVSGYDTSIQWTCWNDPEWEEFANEEDLHYCTDVLWITLRTTHQNAYDELNPLVESPFLETQCSTYYYGCEGTVDMRDTHGMIVGLINGIM